MPEAGTLESAKSYREKKAKPLLAQIVKVLKPDLEVLFDPDHARERPQHDALCREIADCTEDEAAALIPVVQSFLFALRNTRKTDL